MDLFTRSTHNPILYPNSRNAWEAVKVYNPGAVYHEGRYHLFYRAMGEGEYTYSSIGHAVSDDGEQFARKGLVEFGLEPASARKMQSMEDPRVVCIDGVFYMTYTAFDGTVVRLRVATSPDLRNWKRHGDVLPGFDIYREGGVRVKWKSGHPVEHVDDSAGKIGDRTKAGAIFPNKINGKFWMMFNEFRCWLATSDDGVQWQWLPGPFLQPRKGTDLFDNVFVEAGPPPIKTPVGWLVFYHGVNDAIQYHLGMLLLDLNDPTNILFRCDEPVFSPQESYELSGIVDIIPGAIQLLREGKNAQLREMLRKAEADGFMPQVTFVSDAVLVDGMIHLFYGAGDQYVCTATAKLDDILQLIC